MRFFTGSGHTINVIDECQHLLLKFAQHLFLEFFVTDEGGTIMDFYKRALELREETVSHRRWLHSNAEVGLFMLKGQAYVMD